MSSEKKRKRSTKDEPFEKPEHVLLNDVDLFKCAQVHEPDHLNINDTDLISILVNCISTWQDNITKTEGDKNIDWTQICKLMKNENISNLYKKKLSADDYHRLWKYVAYGEIISKEGIYYYYHDYYNNNYYYL